QALKEAQKVHKTAIRNTKILQYLFFEQWMRLKKYCHVRGVHIVGDIPIFVAHDSADVWAHPDLFYLDERGFPTIVAGVPPDYFSTTGQLWGNPLYRWDVHKQTGYKWWILRMKKILEMVDIVRIDHFRGFEKYWEIPGYEKTAIHGRWVEGPGGSLFEEMMRKKGDLPIIAEDLGLITPEVEALRDRFKLPGMRILQFAFGNDDKAADYRPESYPANCVVYTGTHDNDTTCGWFNSVAGPGSTRSQIEIDRERRAVLEYLRTDGHEITWDLIELAMKSNANTVVFPLQDVMGLGSEARMNVPGVEGGNWRWRFTSDMLTLAMKKRMRYLTRATGRLR
ncbi:MAG: 4-alpha-glucanotransferase, partial [Lentisphaerota bacterium]